MNVDLTLFLIEALATNKKIEKEIAKLYEKYKYKAYKEAVSSELYSHPTICDGDIRKEVVSKRLLGLVLLQEEEIFEGLLKLIKKGWPRLFHFLIKQKEISMKTIGNNFCLKSMTVDETNANFVISLIVSNAYDIQIIEDEAYEFCIRSYYNRLNHYSNNVGRFCYENLIDELKKKATNIKNRFFDTYGVIKSIEELCAIQEEFLRNYIEKLSMIFDTEDLMFSNITEHFIITDEEVVEICALYYMIHKNQNREESAKFIVSGIFIKYMIKTYKNVKDYYFKNNKETLFIDMEELENEAEYYKKENEKLKAEVFKLKQDNQRLRSQYKSTIEKENIELIKEIKRLEQQNQELVENEKELFELREFMFEIDNEWIDREEHTEIPNNKGLIIGGHESWQRKLKEKLPGTFKFLDGFKESFDIKVLEGIEYVFFFTGYMNHGVYYKVINYCKKNDIRIRYLKNKALDLVINEIKRKSS